MISLIQIRNALSSAATKRYLSELRLTRRAKQICRPIAACRSRPHSRRRASVSFVPAHPAAWLCRGSDRPPVSSAAGFTLPTGACASAQRTKYHRMPCATYKAWYQKCSTYNRPQILVYPVQPVSGQRQSDLRRIVIFSSAPPPFRECRSCQHSVSEWRRISGQGQLVIVPLQTNHQFLDSLCHSNFRSWHKAAFNVRSGGHF